MCHNSIAPTTRNGTSVDEVLVVGRCRERADERECGCDRDGEGHTPVPAVREDDDGDCRRDQNEELRTAEYLLGVRSFWTRESSRELSLRDVWERSVSETKRRGPRTKKYRHGSNPTTRPPTSAGILAKRAARDRLRSIA